MRQQDTAGARISLFKLISAISNNFLLDKWISITSVGNTEWEKFIVAEAMRVTTEDCGLSAEIKPISQDELFLSKDILNAALSTIARYDADMFDEIQEQVKIIKLFRGKGTMGFTDVRILGAMLIRLPRDNVNPMLYFLEHVIHETSHIHLNCLMATDPIILNLPEERFLSPLRLDPRPMVGVFHAAYVSARIARTFMKLFHATEDRELLHPLAETLDETIRGIMEIEKNAKLTVHGSELVSSIKRFLKSAQLIPEWSQYDFREKRSHRFGAGLTQVTVLQRAVL